MASHKTRQQLLPLKTGLRFSLYFVLEYTRISVWRTKLRENRPIKADSLTLLKVTLRVADINNYIRKVCVFWQNPRSNAFRVLFAKWLVSVVSVVQIGLSVSEICWTEVKMCVVSGDWATEVHIQCKANSQSVCSVLFINSRSLYPERSTNDISCSILRTGYNKCLQLFCRCYVFFPELCLIFFINIIMKAKLLALIVLV